MGGSLGALPFTLTVIAVLVATEPRVSVARAVRMWVPAGALVHWYSYGAWVSVASRVLPA